MGVDISVIIPTRDRAEKLARQVGLLAGERGRSPSFEVLIGTDGDDPAAAERSGAAWAAAGGDADGLRVVRGPSVGQAGVRNRLLDLARGALLVFLNDDMRPEPGLLSAHWEAHAARGGVRAGSTPSLVVGDSPWVVHGPDRLFDRMIRETSMIFFHERMRSAPDASERDWGFRHAWMLNLSIPAWAVREVGGIAELPDRYGYEDDELAFRLAERLGAPVRFAPGAVALHDHRYEPAAYLERERRLGRAALGFARLRPEAAQAMFRRDLTEDDEALYTRAYLSRENAGAERASEVLHEAASLPAEAADGDAGPAIIRAFYAAHLPAKRYAWRLGLMDALDLSRGRGAA